MASFRLEQQMIGIATSEEFERLLKALSDDVIDAHIHFRMYEDLVGAAEKYPLVVQQSNTFWVQTLQAHLNTAVFALFRAYDQDPRALHLRSLLSTVEENLPLFDDAAFRERLKNNPFVGSLVQHPRKPDPKTLAADIEACSNLDPLVKKLTIYRGNRIAHRNAKSVVLERDRGDAGGLTFEDVRILLDRSKTILNRYSDLFAASIYATTVVGREDYEYIFKAVQEKVEAAMQKWSNVELK